MWKIVEEGLVHCLSVLSMWLIIWIEAIYFKYFKIMDFFPTFHSHFITLKTQKRKAAISRHQPNSAISFWRQTLQIRNVRRQCHSNAFNHQLFFFLLPSSLLNCEQLIFKYEVFVRFDLCAAAANVHLGFRRIGRPKSLSSNSFSQILAWFPIFVFFLLLLPLKRIVCEYWSSRMPKWH